VQRENSEVAYALAMTPEVRAWYRSAIPLAEERYELYLKQEGHR